MTPGAKVIFAAAVLCFLLWGAALSLGLQPLITATGLQVIYGEGEDFFSDAVAYRKARNDAFLVLNLPHARPAYRWWTVDFRNQVVRLSGPPRSLSSRRFIIKGDLGGPTVDDRTRVGDWYWHFTANAASFAGNGFTCTVRRTGK
jgi:hypothetical protein